MCTVNTASDIVPMMKAFELRNLSMKGGLVPCWVSEDNQAGRGMVETPVSGVGEG
jgi:hypothetical protein